MQVEVKITLSRTPQVSDYQELMAVVALLSIETQGLTVNAEPCTNVIRLGFAIPNATQKSVVDQIAAAFREAVSHYADINIHFPGTVMPKKKDPFAPTEKQAQDLAFIEGYWNIHRQSPSQMEMQRYFMTTPSIVCQMVLQLEKRGFITRTPGKARNLELVRRTGESAAIPQEHIS